MPEFKGCVEVVGYYWWTCYDATEEGPNNSTVQGWHNNANSFYSKIASPSWYSIFSTEDPYHIDMELAAIVRVCSGGHKHYIMTQAHEELSWNWDKKFKVWIGPVVASRQFN